MSSIQPSRSPLEPSTTSWLSSFTRFFGFGASTPKQQKVAAATQNAFTALSENALSTDRSTANISQRKIQPQPQLQPSKNELLPDDAISPAKHFFLSFLKLACDPKQNVDQLLPMPLAIDNLIELYGQELVNEVALRYELLNAKSLSLKEYRSLLVGIAVHVKPEHLTAYLNKVQAAEPKWQAINAEGRFTLDHLQPKELAEIIGNFKSILPVALVYPQNKKEAANYIGLKQPSKALSEDLDVLQKTMGFQDYQGLDAVLNTKLAIGEYHADLGYGHLKKGMIVPSRLSDGTDTFSQVSFALDENGIGWFILEPLQNKPLQNLEIQVLCRGTVPTDLSSVMRDAEPYAAGYFSTMTRAPELLQGLRNSIARWSSERPMSLQKYKGVQINIIGHSLGGANACVLSERAMTAMSIATMNSRKQGVGQRLEIDPLLQIGTVNPMLYSSPGMNPETISRIVQAEAILNDPEADGSTKAKSKDEEVEGFVHVEDELQEEPVEISLNSTAEKTAKEPINGKVDITFSSVGRKGDLVRRVGYRAPVPELSTPHMKVESFQINGGDKGRIFSNGARAHTTKTFNRRVNQGVVPPYEYANNTGTNTESFHRWASNNFRVNHAQTPVVNSGYESFKQSVVARLFGRYS